MFAGPLAGTLRLTYPRFLMANAAGAACWAGGISIIIHLLGAAADRYLKDASWVLLVVVLAAGLVVGRVVGRSFEHRVERYAAERLAADGGSADPPAPGQ
ncbi:putative membrane protein [bioreactor metagenome]|uniref:Putative membrane protein n=2 Tax=root TaxID=1 RepID=A0A645BJV4_9ZZZZ